MALGNKDELYDTKALGKDQVESWIVNGPSNELVTEVDRFGRYIGFELQKAKKQFKKKNGERGEKTVDESVTNSQIRQVFGKLKSIEAKGYNKETMKAEFLMLKPLIAYAAGRHNKTGMDRLKERVTWGIDAVVNGPEKEEPVRFKNFCKLFEAILAYHKAHGGK